ncbi:hypothetical protein ETB97_001229 [Aspergillus alliaceus]|uniref:Uncharacterized protein n=1 Tax=Petromyces alliaceus TaxID=209559 RepID=A0A8H6A374_PETAA|nr:hypothetical protein ETB97_001229 [Aspergillus burnettii]
MSEKQIDEKEVIDDAILDPLFFLLSARRGIERDPRVRQTAIPDVYTVNYRGKSGVKPINRTPFISRFICGLGRFQPKRVFPFCSPTLISELTPARWSMVASVFGLMRSICGVIEKSKMDTERQAFSRKFEVALACAVLMSLIFFFAKQYARRHAAAATPPQYDPESYQCWLVTAMKRIDLQYKEITTATTLEMESYWKDERALCERFRIDGLVDPEDEHLIYDVVVKFYENGGVVLLFPSATPSQPKPGVVISKV